MHNTLITEDETKTGEFSKIPRVTTDEEAMAVPQTREKVQERIKRLIESCEWFLEPIFESVEQLPYGLRWICKQISEIGHTKFKGISNLFFASRKFVENS